MTTNTEPVRLVFWRYHVRHEHAFPDMKEAVQFAAALEDRGEISADSVVSNDGEVVLDTTALEAAISDVFREWDEEDGA